MRLLILCGVAAPVLRLGLILLLGWLHPSYSQLNDYISELGAPDSPYAAIMNYVGIGAVGVLLMIFSLPLGRNPLHGRLATTGGTLLFLSGAAFVAVGLFPCDRAGCATAGSSAVMQAHILAGFVGMTAQALAPLAIGGGLFARAAHRPYSVASLILGLVSIVSLGLLVSGSAPSGLAQKSMQGAADLWVFLSALYLWKFSGSDSEAARSHRLQPTGSAAGT